MKLFKWVNALLHFWRLTLFAVIAVLGVLLGFLFKQDVRESGLDPNPFSGPSIQVYTSDPNTHVRLSAVSYPGTRANEHLDYNLPSYLSIRLGITSYESEMPVKWVIIVEDLDFALSFSKTTSSGSIAFIPGFQGEVTDKFSPNTKPALVVTGDMNTLNEAENRPRRDNETVLAGTPVVAIITVPFFDESSPAGYYARLPRMYSDRSLVVEFDDNEDATAIVHPLSGPDLLGSAVTRMPNGAIFGNLLYPNSRPEFYVAPLATEFSQRLAWGADQLLGSRVDFITPLDAEVEGHDLVWRSDGNMAPQLRTSSIAFERARSRGDFYSGLAFASAASAVIAAIQELPRTIRRRRAWEPNPNAYL